MFKFEGFKVGDRIRAQDFEDRADRGACHVEGVILVACPEGNEDKPYAHYVIEVFVDVWCGQLIDTSIDSSRIGTSVTVPMETSDDWDGRVTLVESPRVGRADYAERQERRRDRYEQKAERASTESDSRHRRARGAIEGIPPGQPILVGHHSEAHHRRALERHDTNMRKAIDAEKRADYYAGRAESVGTAGISSDDPESLVKLREKLQQLEELQERMKAANRVIRKHKGQESAVPALIAQGFKEASARALLDTGRGCGQGFADYETKNNGANIRRVRERIATLERLAITTEEGEQLRSQGGVIYRIEDNRVQIVFDSKPAEEIRERLISKGFRWARSVGAWQRQLNNAGKYYAREFIEWLDQTYPQEG